MFESATSGCEQSQQTALYSITSSARASSFAGTSRPSAFAVLRLITSSNLPVAPGKGLPSGAFGRFQRVVRATSAHGTYTKSVAVGAALFQNRTAR